VAIWDKPFQERLKASIRNIVGHNPYPEPFLLNILHYQSFLRKFNWKAWELANTTLTDALVSSTGHGIRIKNDACGL